MAKTKTSVRQSASARAQRSFQIPIRKITSGLFVFAFVVIGASFIVGGHAEPQVPNYVCNYGGSSGQACLSAKQNGTSTGTEIFGGAKDFNSNENFIIQQLTGSCNHGRVTTTCPFVAGSGLNTRYLNDEVIQFVDVQSGYIECLGNNGGASGILVPCNNQNGVGGGIGSIFVLNKGGGGSIDFAENQYWSDANYSYNKEYDTPAWLCMNQPVGQSQVDTDNTSPAGGAICQWGMNN